MKKILAIILQVCSCLIIMVGCGVSSNSPSKSQMKSDLSGEYNIVKEIDDVGTGRLQIKEIEVVLADTKDDVYEADLKISLKNKAYVVEKTASVVYKKYDVGGWKLQSIPKSSSGKVKVIGEFPESVALKNVKDYGNVILEDKKSIENKTICEYTFTGLKNGKFFNVSTRFTDRYQINKKGVWERSDSDITTRDYTINRATGLFSFGKTGEGRVLHFNRDSTVTLLIEENNKKITERPQYRFNEDDVTVYMNVGNYQFTLYQNRICFMKSPLETIDYSKHKWLRENFYNECVAFMKEDQENNK